MIPRCGSGLAGVKLPLTVIGQDWGSAVLEVVPLCVFHSTTCAGYHSTTNAGRQVALTLQQNDYRFRPDSQDVQFWSGLANHCTILGCLDALVVIPGGVGGPFSVTIAYTYDPFQRLVAADYSTGDYFHYSYDAVGHPVSLRWRGERPLSEDTLAGTNTYDNARAASRAEGEGQSADRGRRRALYLG